ncbi:hypothetical protein ACFL27_12590 [candidate division CSSED10-310 bacterium]|uniref:Pyrrolidone-carboxylate peptidase n=1 Tax=candidate division CSSED10-310 bacterium TaxID=2855610 RepID=A0ABV6YXW4_UNCC1
MSVTTLLITGFTPFGPYRYNSSQEILSPLANREFKNFRVKTVEIPTSFEKSYLTLIQAFETYKPAMVISFGMAAQSNVFHLEARGRNTLALQINDEDVSRKYKIDPIEPTGPNFRYTTLKIPFFKGEKVPLRLSFDAGTYVCNYLIYTFLGYLEQTKGDNFPYGFIHIPALPRDAASLAPPVRGMAFPTLITEIEVVINQILSMD